MSPLARLTAAVLVVRHPRPDAKAALRALSAQVGVLIVVDNRDQPGAELETAAASCGAVVLHNGNRGVLAGAYNRALDWIARHRPELRWTLFLDEDSDTTVIERFLSDPGTAAVLQDPHCAAVSAAYRERASGLRARYMTLQRWRLHWLPRDFTGPKPVAFVINSMSLWSREALDRIGGFDEQLGLDHIDTDVCLRARHAGYGVWVQGDHVFLHSIGERRRFTLFGREMQAGGHPPQRRWLIARNTVRLARRELLREPAFAWLCLLRLAYEAVGIVLAESQKPAKLAALLRGAGRGLLRA